MVARYEREYIDGMSQRSKLEKLRSLSHHLSLYHVDK